MTITDFTLHLLNKPNLYFTYIYKGDSWLHKIINVFLVMLGSRHYMDKFNTVIGHTLALVSRAEYSTIVNDRELSHSTIRLLAHERVHLLQQERYGRFLYPILYLCSWRWRKTFELEAYRTSMLVDVWFNSDPEWWLGGTADMLVKSYLIPKSEYSSMVTVMANCLPKQFELVYKAKADRTTLMTLLQNYN